MTLEEENQRLRTPSSRGGRYLGGGTTFPAPLREPPVRAVRPKIDFVVEPRISSETIAEDERGLEAVESVSGLPTPPTIGAPPKAPTNNSQFQWRKYNRRMAEWERQKNAQIQQYELNRQSAIDQRVAKIQEGQFEIKEADRIAQLQAAELALEEKRGQEVNVINALDFMRQLDPKDEDYQSKVNEFILEFPSAITDPRVKAILGNKNSINATVSQAREKINQKNAAKEQEAVNAENAFRVKAASEGLTAEETEAAFVNGVYDSVAGAAAIRQGKERVAREGKADTDQSRQEEAVLRLEEEKAGIEARLEGATPDEEIKLQSDLRAINERIAFRKQGGRERKPEQEDNSEVLTEQEAKRLFDLKELKPGTRVRREDGTTYRVKG
jgi:hypothetical protein